MEKASLQRSEQSEKKRIKITTIKSKCKKITADNRDFFMRI